MQKGYRPNSQLANFQSNPNVIQRGAQWLGNKVLVAPTVTKMRARADRLGKYAQNLENDWLDSTGFLYKLNGMPKALSERLDALHDRTVTIRQKADKFANDERLHRQTGYLVAGAGALGLGALGTGAYALTRPKQPDQGMY